jgi:hypothetical protein
VLELETSIAQLKAEIIITETSAKLPPSIGFMTNSELHYSQYDSQTLPENALFSAWILRNENTILSHKVQYLRDNESQESHSNIFYFIKRKQSNLYNN